MIANEPDAECFTFCLRVFHPTLTADDIEARVGQTAKRKTDVGEIRSTSKGTPIDGGRPAKNSLCVFQDVEGLAEDFGTALQQAAEILAARGDQLDALNASGGQASFFVGYFLGPDDTSGGFDIDPETLALLGRLRVRLTVCLYNYAA